MLGIDTHGYDSSFYWQVYDTCVQLLLDCIPQSPMIAWLAHVPSNCCLLCHNPWLLLT